MSLITKELAQELLFLGLMAQSGFRVAINTVSKIETDGMIATMHNDDLRQLGMDITEKMLGTLHVKTKRVEEIESNRYSLMFDNMGVMDFYSLPSKDDIKGYYEEKKELSFNLRTANEIDEEE